ncbi:MAG TPA: hypothetical protein VFH42_05145 [Sporolactobacillaceae bacterium]|nr:hypothetical protein [Sporolactobacillaceae bacterium]
MDTIYKRELWKKRALHGYRSDYVKAQIEERQATFKHKRQALEAKRDDLLHQHRLLQEEVQRLQEGISDQGGSSEQELFKRLGEGYLKALEEQERIERELEAKKKISERHLAEQEEERDRLLSRLKDVMKQLHSTERTEET